ncbi:MAG: carboxypeptidase-like regulatory domain-containing protein [Saprospiraceae bacterium]
MKQSILLFMGVLLSFCLQAQRTVTGVVSDANGPLIGATVQVKGTSVGTITDLDGSFSIRVPDNAQTLVVTYIGYATQEVPVGDGSPLNITLTDDEQALSEVIIIGSRSAGRTKLESAVPVDVLDVSNC